MSDLTVDLVKWSMQLQQLRADTSAHNIALASTPNAQTRRIDFTSQLQAVQWALKNDVNDDAIRPLLTRSLPSYEVSSTSQLASVALDDEIAEMTEANGRFSALSEGVSRHFGLMMIALKRGM